jgi:D-aminopeptidase
VIVATDAPLLPHQCDRLAHRASLGIARTGGAGEHTSGDLLLAFAPGNRPLASEEEADVPLTQPLSMLSDAHFDPLSYAVIEATEEAIVNAMLAAGTMTGKGGATVQALPHERLVEVLDRHGLRRLR